MERIIIAYRFAGVSGIYAIRHRRTGKIYIGSSVNVEQRVAYHRSKLRHGIHDNTHLQRAWSLYGEAEFVFLLLQRCPSDQLASREGWWMAATGCCERSHGYNLDRIAIRKLHSEETKAKIRLAHLGHRHTDETKAKLAAAKLGKKHRTPKTAEQRARYSMALMGHQISLETRAKISAGNKGKIITEIHRQQIRDYWRRRRETKAA